MANEIEKLNINVKGGQTIDDVAVQKYVGISKDYNVFELQKALSLRNETKAYRIVKYFASNPTSNPLIPIIANLYAYFSKLLILHHNGASDKNEAARLIGVNPYFVSEYLQATRNYSMPKVIDNLKAVSKADLHSKGIGTASTNHQDILVELTF